MHVAKRVERRWGAGAVHHAHRVLSFFLPSSMMGFLSTKPARQQAFRAQASSLGAASQPY